MKNKISQGQFRAGYAPQEHVMPHSMDNREAGSPSKQRKRSSIALGFQSQARPGLAGIQGRNKPIKRNTRGR
jgi:hypothetical protein